MLLQRLHTLRAKKIGFYASPWLPLLVVLSGCGSDAQEQVEQGCPPGAPLSALCESPITSAPVLDAGGTMQGAFDAALVADAAQPSSAPRSDAAVSAWSDAGDAGLRPTDADAGVDSGSVSFVPDASPQDASTNADARTEDAEAGAGITPRSFVDAHGPLHVDGNRVVDSHGHALQLRGMSWFWSQWTDFYVEKNVDVLVDDWKGTLVRAALGVENEGGYLESPQANLAKVRTIVDRAIARGIYVLIDWHDHHAQDHQAQAMSFFQQMAQTYGAEPNVIFEVYNEPMNVAWPAVKAYAEQIIRTIRAAGSRNLIIVGTPNWSQDVDIAANSRITSDDNVAYTLHFYANTHKQELRDKAKAALDRGIPLFVTEWGTCAADGNGSINEGETRTWMSFLAQHSISWANWALNNKAEACSALRPSASSTGPWSADQLTPSGKLVKSLIP